MSLQGNMFCEGEMSMESIKEDMLKMSIKLANAASENKGWKQHKLDLAKVHVEVAMRQIYHILDPMTQLEYSYRSLARDLGCSRSLVWHWGQGTKPSERFLPVVCDILGIEPDFLWPEGAD